MDIKLFETHQNRLWMPDKWHSKQSPAIVFETLVVFNVGEVPVMVAYRENKRSPAQCFLCAPESECAHVQALNNWMGKQANLPFVPKEQLPLEDLPTIDIDAPPSELESLPIYDSEAV